MKLPNAEQMFIPQRKLIDYLLSTTHPSGRSKAAFFARFVFTEAVWESLAAPDERTPRIRSAWFIETGDVIPRLVTADPLKEGGK